VLGGVLVAVAGTDVAYWVNAATFLLSAALLSGIPATLLQSAAALTRGHWRDLADGFRVVAHSRPLVLVLVVWSIAMLGMACINVGQVFLADDVFDAGSFGYGLLFGSVGLGLVVGSMVGGNVLGERPVANAYPLALGLMGVGFVAAAVAPSIWIAAAFCVVGGVGNGTANVCNALLVQRGTTDDVRGRALTLVMSTTYLALGVGMAAAGPLVEVVGPRAAWGVAAGMFGAASVVGLSLARGIREQAVGHVAEVEQAA
jgi:MFS family permease